MLCMICTHLHQVHLSICVEDSSRRSEEIVKNLELSHSVWLLLLLLLLSLHHLAVSCAQLVGVSATKTVGITVAKTRWIQFS